MPRTITDTSLQSPTARTRLAVQHDYYRRSLDRGLHLLYRRGERGGAWAASLNIEGKRRVETLGTADDRQDADGVTILTYSQAQAAARKAFDQATRTAHGLPDAPVGPYTVAMAVADYIKWLEQDGRGEQSINDTRRAMHAHVIPKFGDTRVDRLTTEAIKGWLSGLAKAAPRLRVKAGTKQRHRDVDMRNDEVRRQRHSSANRILTFFRAALNLAWRSNKVASDNAWRSVKSFKGADASRARYLQLEECRRLIDACAEDFAELVQGGLHTGARFSELARLEVADFNLDVGTVAVRKSKSGRPRHVVLTDEGRAFFAATVKRAGNRQVLFVRADGEPWKSHWQIRPMKAACKAAKIAPAAGFHILRHTWASLSVMSGAPLLVVARALGHTDTRMVEKHYGHLSPSYESEVIRRHAPRFEVVTPTS